MGLVNVRLTNVNFDDDNFDNDDPETIIHVTLIALFNRYKWRKACKKNNQSINYCSVASSKLMGLVRVRR